MQPFNIKYEMKTHLVLQEPEVIHGCDVKHIYRQLIELTILHALWRMCILERMYFQTFMRIECEISTLETVGCSAGH